MATFQDIQRRANEMLWEEQRRKAQADPRMQAELTRQDAQTAVRREQPSPTSSSGLPSATVVPEQGNVKPSRSLGAMAGASAGSRLDPVALARRELSMPPAERQGVSQMPDASLADNLGYVGNMFVEGAKAVPRSMGTALGATVVDVADRARPGAVPPSRVPTKDELYTAAKKTPQELALSLLVPQAGAAVDVVKALPLAAKMFGNPVRMLQENSPIAPQLETFQLATEAFVPETRKAVLDSLESGGMGFIDDVQSSPALKADASVFDAREDKSMVWKVIGDLAQNMPQLVSGVAANAVAPGSGLAMMGSQIAGADLEAKKYAAMSPQERMEAYHFSTAKGMGEGALEQLGLEGVLGKTSRAGLVSLGQKARAVLGDVLRAAGPEGATEYLQSYVDPIVEAGRGDEPYAVRLEKLFDEVTSLKFQKNALYAGGLGAMLGGGTNLAVQGIDAASRSIGEDYRAKPEDDPRLASRVAKADTPLDSITGAMGGTGDFAAYMAKSIQTDAKAGMLQQLPDNDLQALAIDASSLLEQMETSAMRGEYGSVLHSKYLAMQEALPLVMEEQARRDALPPGVREAEALIAQEAANLDVEAAKAGAPMASAIGRMGHDFRQSATGSSSAKIAGTQRNAQGNTATTSQEQRAILERRIGNLESSAGLAQSPEMQANLERYRKELAALDAVDAQNAQATQLATPAEADAAARPSPGDATPLSEAETMQMRELADTITSLENVSPPKYREVVAPLKASLMEEYEALAARDRGAKLADVAPRIQAIEQTPWAQRTPEMHAEHAKLTQEAAALMQQPTQPGRMDTGEAASLEVAGEEQAARQAARQEETFTPSDMDEAELDQFTQERLEREEVELREGVMPTTREQIEGLKQTPVLQRAWGQLDGAKLKRDHPNAYKELAHLYGPSLFARKQALARSTASPLDEIATDVGLYEDDALQQLLGMGEQYKALARDARKQAAAFVEENGEGMQLQAAMKRSDAPNAVTFIEDARKNPGGQETFFNHGVAGDALIHQLQKVSSDVGAPHIELTSFGVRHVKAETGKSRPHSEQELLDWIELVSNEATDVSLGNPQKTPRGATSYLLAHESGKEVTVAVFNRRPAKKGKPERLQLATVYRTTKNGWASEKKKNENFLGTSVGNTSTSAKPGLNSFKDKVTPPAAPVKKQLADIDPAIQEAAGQEDRDTRVTPPIPRDMSRAMEQTANAMGYPISNEPVQDVNRDVAEPMRRAFKQGGPRIAVISGKDLDALQLPEDHFLRQFLRGGNVAAYSPSMDTMFLNGDQQLFAWQWAHTLAHEGVHSGKGRLAATWAKNDAGVARSLARMDDLLAQLYAQREGAMRADPWMRDHYFSEQAGPAYDPATKEGRIALAEEYLAQYGTQMPGTWYDRYVFAVRQLMRSVAEAVGRTMGLSDLDVRVLSAMMVEANFTPVPGTAGNVGGMRYQGNDDRSREVTAASEQFQKQVDALQAGESFDRPLDLGQTPQVLQAVGAKPLPVTMRQEVVAKATKDKHALTIDQLKQVVEKLHDPIMVFESKDGSGNLVAMLELQDADGKTVVAAVHLEKQEQNHIINRVASVYGKDNDGAFLGWIRQGLLLYQHKQKSLEWSRSRGLQLPKEGTIQGKKKILTESDVVKPYPGLRRQAARPLRTPSETLKRLEPELQALGFRSDNPGGNWIKDEVEYARKERSRHGRVAGTITASFRGVSLPVQELANIPGQMGEQAYLDRDDHQQTIDDLAKSMREEGYHADNPIAIDVEFDGRATVYEGNHRILAAQKAGIDRIPVEIRYLAGGETKTSVLSPENVLNMASTGTDIRYQASPALALDGAAIDSRPYDETSPAAMEARRAAQRGVEDAQGARGLQELQRGFRTGTLALPAKASPAHWRQVLRGRVGSSRRFTMQEYIHSGIDDYLADLSNEKDRVLTRSEILREMSDRTAKLYKEDALALAFWVGRGAEAGATLSKKDALKVFGGMEALGRRLDEWLPGADSGEKARWLRSLQKYTESEREKSALRAMADMAEGLPAPKHAMDRSFPFKKRRAQDPVDENGNKIERAPEELEASIQAKLRWGVPQEESLLRKTHDYLRDFWDRREQKLVDRFAPLRHLDENAAREFGAAADAMEDIAGSAYMHAHLTAASGQQFQSMLENGTLEILEDNSIAVKEGTTGLLSTFRRIQEHGGERGLQDFFAWIVGERAARLWAEGREANFTPDEIKQMRGKLNDSNRAAWEQAHAEMEQHRKALMAIAAKSGIVNKEMTFLFETQFYVPFYRALEDGGKAQGDRASRGLTNQRGLRKLKGSDKAIADPLSNVLQNFATLIESSNKNRAALNAIEKMKRLGLAEKASMQVQLNFARGADLEHALRGALGEKAELLTMTQEEKESFGAIFLPKNPRGDNIISVMEDGRVVHYEVHDTPLLEALTAINHNKGKEFLEKLGPLGAALTGSKRLLTQGVTNLPGFWIRNFIRDTANTMMASPVGNGNVFTWTIGSLKDTANGIGQIMRDDQAVIQARTGGGLFSGYDYGYTGEQAAKAMRKRLAKSLDVKEASILNTPGRVAGVLKEHYLRVGEASESANRMAVYNKVLEQTGSHAMASFEARDMMNFSKRGDVFALQILAETVPFLNARIQGLARLGRSAKVKTMRRRLLTVGGLMALASAAHAFAQFGNPDYEELPDYEKDLFWHFWINGQHYRLPKPFELGFVFGTVPQRLTEMALRGLQGDPDAFKAFRESMWWNIAETLNFDPTPQLVKPAWEVANNHNAFRDAPIDSPFDNREPGRRSDARTSDTAALVGEALNVSPKKLEHLVRGYTGTLGTHVLEGVDMVVAEVDGSAAKPAKAAHETVLVRELTGGAWRGPREAVPYTTKYMDAFFDLRDRAKEKYDTLKDYREKEAPEEAAEYFADHKAILTARPGIERTARWLGDMRKREERIRRDASLTPEAKRVKLDALRATKHRQVKTDTLRAKGMQ